MTLEEINRFVWYVARTHWRAENRARSSLEGRDYRAFYPTCHVQVRHAGKVHLVERAMFPSYVFAGLRPGQAWYPIMSTPGVAGLLLNREKPVQIPQWIMRNLVHAQETGAFNAKVATIEGKEGDKVRFVGGNFAGFVGVIQRASPGRRVQVLVEMFGKQHDFSVPLAELEAA